MDTFVYLQNQFNLILLSSVDAMLKVSHSQAFHIPVNAKYAPDYYQVYSDYYYQVYSDYYYQVYSDYYYQAFVKDPKFEVECAIYRMFSLNSQAYLFDACIYHALYFTV